MRTRTVIALLAILGFTHASYGSGLSHINYQAIEFLPQYEAELSFVYNNQQWLWTYIPEDRWNAPVGRADLREQVLRLYDLLNQYEEPTNVEYLLLRALVSEFRYRLDVSHSFQSTVDHYRTIERVHRYDYRSHWFLGLFLAKAARPFDALPEFRLVANRVPEHQIHPDFFFDYGYAASLCFMEATSIEQYGKYYQYTNTSPPEDGWYRTLVSNFVTPTLDQTIPQESLFRLLERETGLGLLSRPLGYWIPIEWEWGLRQGAWQNGVAAVLITPEAINTDETPPVTYTIMVMSYRDPDAINRDWMDRFASVRPTSLPELPEYRVFEYSDPSIYQHMGGARGLMVVIESPLPDRPSIAIEEPSLPPRRPGTTNASGYLPFTEHYGRVPTSLSHIVLLDSSEMIFDEARERFIEFIRRSAFE